VGTEYSVSPKTADASNRAGHSSPRLARTASIAAWSPAMNPVSEPESPADLHSQACALLLAQSHSLENLEFNSHAYPASRLTAGGGAAGCTKTPARDRVCAPHRRTEGTHRLPAGALLFARRGQDSCPPAWRRGFPELWASRLWRLPVRSEAGRPADQVVEPGPASCPPRLPLGRARLRRIRRPCFG
jgi:hypothetical protein